MFCYSSAGMKRKMFFMFAILACLGDILFTNVHCKKHFHPVPTYFHRVDGNGNVIDRSGVLYDQIFNYKIADEISSLDTATASVTLSPSLIPTGGKVTVKWRNIASPSSRDWIGFYCPPDDLSLHALDYFFVTEGDQGSWADGFGSKTVRVFNLRTKCEFRYFRFRDQGLSLLVGRSNRLEFIDGAQSPNQGRIALTGKSNQMRIMWTSGNVTNPHVKFGLTKSALLLSATGTSTTYKASDMCGPPATGSSFKDPGLLHDVLLDSLLPKTRYFYSFGSKEAMSPVYNFTTPFPAGDPSPYKFIIYGDMGVDSFPQGKETAVRMVEEYNENDVKLIFHHGDISYARGYAYIWDQWHALIEPYSTLIPYMVGIGNHEQDHTTGGSKDPSGATGEGFHPSWGNYGDDSGGECGVPMFKRFHMPDNGNHLWWYSYDYGLVHYIMMSTEHDFSPDSRQFLWLQNDLAKVNRKLTPWVIIAGHRAMYDSQDEWGDYTVAVNMQRLFEDLLYKHKVDMAFWAHYHSYERTCKVYRNQCREDGITHIVVGTAGKSLDSEPWLGKKWSLVRYKTYGYGRVTVYNSTAMMFEFIQNKDMAVLDTVVLHK